MKQFPSIRDYTSKNNFNCNRFHHWRKSLMKIKTMDLMKSFCHQPCFIFINGAICIGWVLTVSVVLCTSSVVTKGAILDINSYKKDYSMELTRT